MNKNNMNNRIDSDWRSSRSIQSVRPEKEDGDDMISKEKNKRIYKFEKIKEFINSKMTKTPCM